MANPTAEQTISCWTAVEGAPAPLGLTYIPEEHAYNFALYSRHATALTLLLYAESDPVNPVDTYDFQFPQNKTSRIWHCRLPAARIEKARYYAYRVHGPFDPSQGHRFDPEKILLDPYARCLWFPPDHSREAASHPGSNAGKAPLGVIFPATGPCDWTGETRPRHTHDTIIYEMHVKGFTARENSGVAPDTRGTYAGAIEKIPYLQELGITAVELLPVFQYDPKENNYWGYMPLNFFSPHQSYSAVRTPGAPLDEFRAMVKAFHEAGIEVLLDAVYNHTTEKDQTGPNYCFRGIDNSTYYLLDHRDRAIYRDDAGCGNVLRAANPAVRKLILDSIRFWVREARVDGLRFDLASILTRNDDGSINPDDPPAITEITSDTECSDIRLIAEAWDLSAYQLGSKFPGMTWLQWNGQFRDEVRQFVKSDPGMVGALMRRLYGSDDLFPEQLEFAYRPYQSVNYVCSHDGYNLKDLVSYNSATGWNCGWEGDDNVPPDVARLRERQVKNFCTLLLLANGTPMFCMGDEVMHTQRGNSNPYDQDNETTWLDWSLREKNARVFRFFQKMIAFRKAHPSIAQSTFWRGNVHWYGVNGPPDLSDDSHTLAYRLNEIYVMINAYWEPLEFTIQEGGPGDWLRVVDTSLDSPNDIGDPVAIRGLTYGVDPRSVAVFVHA